MAWNQPSPSPPKSNRCRKKCSYHIALCIVIVVLASAFWLIIRDEVPDAAVPMNTDNGKQIAKHLPSPSTTKIHHATPAPPVVKPKSKKIPPKPSFMDEKPRSEWDSREVALAYQWYAKDPSNRVHGVDMGSRVPPPVFSNLVQEAMAPYLEIGADVLPMGRISDDEARIAIDTPIDFNYDDPDDLLAKKQGVKEMLEELKQFMKEGGHAQEYFDRLESRQALEHETMQEVRNQVRDLEREGDVEGAKEALKVYNKYLEDKGLPRIHMKIRNKQPQIEE